MKINQIWVFSTSRNWIQIEVKAGTCVTWINAMNGVETWKKLSCCLDKRNSWQFLRMVCLLSHVSACERKDDEVGEKISIIGGRLVVWFFWLLLFSISQVLSLPYRLKAEKLDFYMKQNKNKNKWIQKNKQILN